MEDSSAITPHTALSTSKLTSMAGYSDLESSMMRRNDRDRNDRQDSALTLSQRTKNKPIKVYSKLDCCRQFQADDDVLVSISDGPSSSAG